MRGAGPTTLGIGRGSLALAIVLSYGLLLGACAGPVDPYRAAVDELPLPSAWHATKTIARGEGGETGCVQLANPMCPSVTRYYSVPGELPDLYQQARAAVVQSGFADVQDVSPNCDLLTNGALCTIVARGDDVQIAVNLYPAGQDVDALGIALPERPTVRVIAEHP